MNWETEIDKYMLLYIKQITNKDLVYSTENKTQWSVMAIKGEESKKEWIYVFVYLLHFSVQQKLTNIVNQDYSNKN